MKQFNAPIPGQSLTLEPKAYPWERPPEINDPEEAIQMHLTRLSKPEMMQDILNIIELQDIDIYTLTKGILRGAVAEGIHSVDVGLIAGPVIHEFIKQSAKAAGVPADDGFEDKTAKEEERRSVEVLRAKKYLSTMKDKPKMPEKPQPQQEAPVVQPKGAGLMSRGEM